MPDMDFDFEFFLAAQAFLTLLVIMDPLGNVPVFLALTADHDRPDRLRVARHATAAATLLIYIFAFFGTQILAYLGIGVPALQAAGGVMLFLIALQMFRGEVFHPRQPGDAVNVAVVPLGVPLLAGPGAIAAVMVFMTGPEGGRLDLDRQLSVVLAIAAALTVIYVALRFAPTIERLLKPSGIHLITRVMGMLLLAIAVDLVASAVLAYSAEVGT
jgi:multiple antibiotic resistance protein